MVRHLMSIALILGLSNPSVAATPELRSELSRIAKSVDKLLRDQRLGSVSIDRFSGLPELRCSSDPAIVEILSDEFRKLGIPVDRHADVRITGEYSIANEAIPDSSMTGLKRKSIALEIHASVFDKLGREITGPEKTAGVPSRNQTLKAKITHEETMIEMLGINVWFNPRATTAERIETLRKAVADPPAYLSGTLISTRRNSPYAVEILVKGKARLAKLEDGFPSLKIADDETYAVRLVNTSSHDAAVRVSIDGLNIFDFSELRHANGPRRGQPQCSFFLVPRQGELILKGWHKTNDRFEPQFGESHTHLTADKLGHRRYFGTISVQFTAVWSDGVPPPADEFGEEGRSTSFVTGSAPSAFKDSEPSRKFGKIRDVINVRYSN